MAEEKARIKMSEGPGGFENWRRALAGVPCCRAFEVPLYSDTEVTGHMPAKGPNPYSFLNAHAYFRGHDLAQVVTMRVDVFIDDQVRPLPDIAATDLSRYHGGSLADEIAALAGLLLGMRLRAGQVTRDFSGDDPKGHPRAEHQRPVLPPARRGTPLVASAHRSKNLNGLLYPLLLTYPSTTG